jgi:hypothetical protein
VSYNPQVRLKAHIRNNRVPKDSKIKILFKGSREQCFFKERDLRPQKRVGWNNAVGGYHGYRIGFSHSQETKDHLKSKWNDERKQKASKFKSEQNKKLKGQKRPKQSIAVSSSNNPMYGTTRPQSVRDAVSKASRNREPINKQHNYCIGCRERASLSRIQRYHSKCRKLFYNAKVPQIF